MYVSQSGKIINEELTDELLSLFEVRNMFYREPLVGVQQMIDFAEMQKDTMRDAIKQKFEETLFIHKYPEEKLLKIYDTTRWELYQYYKTSF